MRSWVADRVAHVEPPKTYLVAKALRLPATTIGCLVSEKLERCGVFSLQGECGFLPSFVSTDLSQPTSHIQDLTGWWASQIPLSCECERRFAYELPIHIPDISPDFACPKVSVSSDILSDRLSRANILTPPLLPSSLVGPNLVGQHPAAISVVTPPIRFRIPEVDIQRVRWGRLRPPSIGSYPAPGAPTVSRNLLQPFPPVRISGCVFASTPERRPPTSPPFDRFGRSEESRRPHSHFGTTQSFDQRQPPIWPYLLAFLKPALRLDRLRECDLPGTLYPFQVEGVRKLIDNEAFLLADEMGTGKTVMTSVALRILLQQGKIHRTLILCPKSILSVWHRHIRDWSKPLSVVVVAGMRSVRELAWKTPAHVYVTTYDTARNDLGSYFRAKYSPRQLSAHLGGFEAIVLDEAQAVKNPASGRSKATRVLSQNTVYNWALSGTPLQNSTSDLFTICDILRIPSLRPEETFRRWRWRVPSAPDLSPEEIRRAIEPHFLRRRKQDVFPELPGKLRSDEWLELDNDQRDEYEATLAQGQQEFCSGEKTFTRMHIFALIHKLKKICNFAGGKHTSPKTLALLDHVREVIDSGKKVLVFTQYKGEGVHKLRRLLDRFGVETITGDSTNRQRHDAVERFQSDPSRRVFLATPKTAGEGITLTAASYVIHFDHWWNPAVAWQAEDRAHRKGQTETVNVYSLWMADTIEERIRDILERKGLLHTEIIDSLSTADFDKALTLDDLLSVLDLDRKRVRIR